ncbi:hypothetical protein HDA32_004126 [Spinactinospora alkalitolerans]|uniref:Uncharacterized protein n=1 Tax=Spinactinospora alkalitolerans TaxID=687207 RepID=A0A852TWX1_9ACTN|nr:hypothetical protein [Spinactinospora alkalitolerans]NYE49006.1 hypothetical protein [Spinactinospora alkalitolerans]
MYNLTPALELRRARAEFTHYEVCEFHDRSGVAEYTAVLKPGRHYTGLAELICAGTITELSALLRAQPRPQLPRRTRTTTPPDSPDAA